MIEVKYENDKFYVKGSIDLGYIGTYKNEDWITKPDITKPEGLAFINANNGHIIIRNTYEEIIESIKDGSDWIQIEPYLDGKSINSENYAKAIENYYNDFEKKIHKNSQQVNDTFLYHVFRPYSDKLEDYIDFFYETPNDGSMEKPHFESIFSEIFPELDINILLDAVKGTSLALSNGKIIFQCDDTLGKKFLNRAYAEIKPNLEFYDWKND